MFVISLFDHWQYAVIPHTSFILVNAVVRRWKILKSMEPPNGKKYRNVWIQPKWVLICYNSKIVGDSVLLHQRFFAVCPGMRQNLQRWLKMDNPAVRVLDWYHGHDPR